MMLQITPTTVGGEDVLNFMTCGSSYTTFEMEAIWSFRTIFPVCQSARRRISKDDSLHQYRCESLKYCRICVTDNLTIPTHLTSNCQSAFALSRLLSINLCIRNLFQLAFAATLCS